LEHGSSSLRTWTEILFFDKRLTLAGTGVEIYVFVHSSMNNIGSMCVGHILDEILMKGTISFNV